MIIEASAQRRGRIATGAPGDMTQTVFRFCQRWRDGRDSRRPAGEPFNPSRFHVGFVEHGDARAFVEHHHYSGSYVAARVEVGLWHRRAFSASALVGVCVFSQPMNQHVVPARTGHPAAEGVELGRFVLLDEVKANAETWMLARAFNELKCRLPDVRAVVSYSDPVPRRTVDGALVMPGHVGTIYQAFNGRYGGRSCARRRTYGPDGREVSQRALSKLRRGEQGAEYAYRDLITMGAPSMRRGEAAPDYIRRALAEGPFTTVKHPGNYVYVWGLDRRARRRLPAPAGGYPKATVGRTALGAWG